MKRYYSIKEVMEYLGVSRDMIHKFRKQGMPYVMIGGSVKFELKKIDKWVIETNKQKA